MPGVTREIFKNRIFKKKTRIFEEKNRIFEEKTRNFLIYVTNWLLKGFLNKFQPIWSSSIYIHIYIYIFGPAVWQAKGNIYTNVLFYYLDWNILNHEAETNISTWMVPGWYQARSQEGAKGQGHPLSPKIGVQRRICTPSLFLNKLLGLFFFWKIWILLFKFFWNYYQSDAMYL